MGGVKRLGLLGGTFNPPHLGHLILGEMAREQLGLERVLFLPAGQPPHKEDETIITPTHRMTMTRLAVGGNPGFAVDNTDADRPAPHHTVTLLPLLAEAYPDYQFWLLLGGDSLRDLPTWHRPGEIVAQAKLAVLPRPGATIEWDRLEEAVPGVRAATNLLEGPSVAISSTRIRAWAAAGRSLRYLVPEAVRTYIGRNGLYQG